MGQNNNTTERKKWKQLSERERYQIEVLARLELSPACIGKYLGRDRRTIERELKRGRVTQRRANPYASRNPAVPDYLEQQVYCADAGQRTHDRLAANKGRGLKIGHDHELARYIEKEIGENKKSPDAVIGEIKEKGSQFATNICTKTVYNMLGKGIFLHISNKDLPVKKNGKKRKHHKTRSVALNNL